VSFVPVERGGCHGCSAASRIRPETPRAKKGFWRDRGEKSPRFEVLLRGSCAVESLGFPIAAKKEREGQALTFGMEIVAKYLTDPFPKGRHFKI